jgi:hypothetical protein
MEIMRLSAMEAALHTTEYICGRLPAWKREAFEKVTDPRSHQRRCAGTAWMPGSSPGMTNFESVASPPGSAMQPFVGYAGLRPQAQWKAPLWNQKSGSFSALIVTSTAWL